MRINRFFVAMVAALLFLSGLAAAPAAGEGAGAAAAGPPTVTLGGATTDNYKWPLNKTGDFVNGDPRTSLLFSSITIPGGATYVIDQGGFPGDAGGTPHSAPSAAGVPLKTSAGVSDGTTIRADFVPNPDGNSVVYRMFSDGTFGPWAVVKRARTNPNDPTSPWGPPLTEANPIGMRFDLVRAGAVVGTTTVQYAADAAIAAVGSSSWEYKGPHGRWSVNGAPTPLNWPAALAITPTTATANVATDVTITPMDMAGITIPRYAEPISMTWNPAAGRPTSAPGSGPRTFSTTFPAGTHTVTASTSCVSDDTIGVTCAPTKTQQIVASSASPTTNLATTGSVLAATAKPGDVLEFTAKVKNTGGQPAPGAAVTYAPTDGLVLQHLANSTGASCDQVAQRCPLGSIAAGATATVTLTFGVTKAGAQKVTYTASTTAPETTTADNVAVPSTTATGPSCTILGTPNDDPLASLTGDANANVICGFGGNDAMAGGSGDDVLIGGPGDDTIAGDGGNDVVYGDTGADRLSDNAVGSNTFYGGIGNDTITAGSASVASTNKVMAGAGDDTVTTGAGVDQVYGEAGNDMVAAGAGNDTLVGGPGDDALDGAAGVDTVSAEDATAAVAINLTQLRLDCDASSACGLGTDTLTAIESAIGSKYADQLLGDAKANVLDGGSGADTITGYGGADTLYGRVGTDKLFGDGGDSVAGDDTLYPGADTYNDVVNGQGGVDTVRYDDATAGITLTLAAGTAAATATGQGSDSVQEVENIYGSAFADVLTGNSGANSIHGLGGVDIIKGGSGNDRLYVRDGLQDTVDGGPGTDRAQADPVDAVTSVEGDPIT